MPAIRYITDKDIAKHGVEAIEVAATSARRLIADRRAELVVELEVTSVLTAGPECDTCPDLGCENCPRTEA